MQKKFEQTISELRDEVKKLDSENEQEVKSRISALILELEQLKQDNPAAHKDFIENLQEALTEFEISHPRITGILNQLMLALGNMGI